MRGSDVCVNCDVLLTCVEWTKPVRLRGKDGIFRKRSKKMKSLRCMDCGYVRPTILGRGHLDVQTMCKGGGSSSSVGKVGFQDLGTLHSEGGKHN